VVTKEQAEYQLSLQDAQCECCEMYKTGECDLVIGMIEPYAVCKYFEPIEDGHR
jgi:hypothetical protein